MFRNRISGYFQDADDAEPMASAGFVVVPIAYLPACAQEPIQRQRSIYELAFAQAKADNQPVDPDWFVG